MRTIQFETIVDNGVIHVPEQYVNIIPVVVNVTLGPFDQEKPKIKSKSGNKPCSIDEFPAIFDTKGWKFNREEANER